MGEYNTPDDPRSYPDRGVRIKPMPRIMHRAYRRFVRDVSFYVRSHISTWKLANREIHEDRIIQANLIYWESVLKFLDHLEYLGTSNDSVSRGGSAPRTDR